MTIPYERAWNGHKRKVDVPSLWTTTVCCVIKLVLFCHDDVFHELFAVTAASRAFSTKAFHKRHLVPAERNAQGEQAVPAVQWDGDPHWNGK